jgi:hypothetical protein
MKRHTYQSPMTATLTGIETEGELAGELVAPEIFVWKINTSGRRYAVNGKIPHGTKVKVSSRAETDVDGLLYYVRQNRGPKGWVTARFVDFGEN